jgi:nuclear pore complex protein Nup155
MRIQRDLSNLRQFIDSEIHNFDMVGSQWSDRSEIEAFQIEMQLINALRALLTQTVEAISFVLLLIDYKLPDVVAS